jgi:hypothetical protein
MLLWNEEALSIMQDKAIRAQSERNRALRAETLRLNLRLARLYFRKCQIKLSIFALKTPDYLTAALLVFFRHAASPPDRS